MLFNISTRMDASETPIPIQSLTVNGSTVRLPTNNIIAERGSEVYNDSVNVIAELNAAYPIERIEHYAAQGGNYSMQVPSSITVYLSTDGASWTPVGNMTDLGEIDVSPYEPVHKWAIAFSTTPTARYVRYVISKPFLPAYTSISELRIYVDADAPPAISEITLSPEEVKRGDEITATAILTNPRSVAMTVTMQVKLETNVIHTDTVTIPANGSTEYTTSFTIDTVGRFYVCVDIIDWQ